MRTIIDVASATHINNGIISSTSKSFGIFTTRGDIPTAESNLKSRSMGKITDNSSFFVSKTGLNTILSGAEAFAVCFCYSVVGGKKRVFLRIVKIIRDGITDFLMGDILPGSRDIFYTKFNSLFVGSATSVNAGNVANVRHQNFVTEFTSIFDNTGWLLYKKDFVKLSGLNPTLTGVNFRIGVTGKIVQLYIEVYKDGTLLSTYSTANAATSAGTACPPILICPYA